MRLRDRNWLRLTKTSFQPHQGCGFEGRPQPLSNETSVLTSPPQKSSLLTFHSLSDVIGVPQPWFSRRWTPCSLALCPCVLWKCPCSLFFSPFLSFQSANWLRRSPANHLPGSDLLRTPQRQGYFLPKPKKNAAQERWM